MIEGQNFLGFWQIFSYPNFLYYSHCCKIGYSFEFCHKRRSPPKDKEPQDGGTTNQIHIRKPANQVQSRPQQQPKTWQAPQGRKIYRPVANHPEGEGTSGTKDSLGRDIPSPAIHNDNQVP
ncbi:hypothetical protein FRX31_010306 [Thalictrum thalictroides]|uniref:Uncharacterized protein n=1 Tax=Thalictrum thalictroides TaxID=46969 RepID=A0A7J6WT26_THATH|nr:hypothetical protein FRX31_010306 [Thalictrum thalictroides]